MSTLAILVALAVVPMFVLLRAARVVGAGISSCGWPEVDGVIVASHVQDARSGGAVWVMRYRFHRNGKPRFGDRFLHGHPTTLSRPEARRLRARHPLGSAIRIRLHPSGERSAMMPGVAPHAWGVLLLSALTLAVLMGVAVAQP